MDPLPVIAIFDIGRTYKKFLLFDQDYRSVSETSVNIPDIGDEDGDPCENLEAIRTWMKEELRQALQDKRYDIQAVNFSAHGASMVHIDAAGNPVTLLYDYRKPLDEELTNDFYELFGGRPSFSRVTGSPVLDMLNSGIQLYWLKNRKPEKFANVHTSLHLPQYGNYLFSGNRHADITSIGCHTGLWDFENRQYHSWLAQEGVEDRLPAASAITLTDPVRYGDRIIPTGIGVHDSSAALLPFVYTAPQPFLFLSSGTWNISLHPFFGGKLSDGDYEQDCLYYLLDVHRPVAASRLFLGNEHDYQVKKLAAYFSKQEKYYLKVQPDAKILEALLTVQSADTTFYPETMSGTGPFPWLKGAPPDLSRFGSFEVAYHQLMLDLTYLQKVSLSLLTRHQPVSRMYISGGFVQSGVFMELLNAFLPGWEIFIAENKHASALGAAIALHEAWQRRPLSETITSPVRFKPRLNADLSSYRSFFESR